MFLFYVPIGLDELTSFQTGVDTIFNGCKTYGSTPTASTPAAIVNSIKAIYTNRYNAGYNAGAQSGYKYKTIAVTGLDHNCNYTHTVSDTDVTQIVAAAILYAYTGPNADGWGKNAIINVSVSGKNIRVTTNVTSGVYFYYKAITFLIVYK